jgi:type IV pilus assembly protein PilV
MSSRNRASMRAQRGVGIVEILVAVLVLSIGLLGLAGLQMRTLRNNESALERGVAVFETHAIVDAMRADRSNAIANLYNIALTASAPTGTTFRERALRAWRGNLTTSLGAGATGEVTCNGTACTIKVQWDDSRVNGGSQTYQVVTQVQL